MRMREPNGVDLPWNYHHQHSISNIVEYCEALWCQAGTFIHNPSGAEWVYSIEPLQNLPFGTLCTQKKSKSQIPPPPLFPSSFLFLHLHVIQCQISSSFFHVIRRFLCGVNAHNALVLAIGCKQCKAQEWETNTWMAGGHRGKGVDKQDITHPPGGMVQSACQYTISTQPPLLLLSHFGGGRSLCPLPALHPEGMTAGQPRSHWHPQEEPMQVDAKWRDGAIQVAPYGKQLTLRPPLHPMQQQTLGDQGKALKILSSASSTSTSRAMVISILACFLLSFLSLLFCNLYYRDIWFPFLFVRIFTHEVSHLQMCCSQTRHLWVCPHPLDLSFKWWKEREMDILK